MNVESVSLAGGAPIEPPKAVDKLDDARKDKENAAQGQPAESQLQPEEMLQQIKALTEDGVYSVRFENDAEVGELVVKVVDRETDEVIRQIPPEELLDLTKRLNDLRGNIVDTKG